MVLNKFKINYPLRLTIIALIALLVLKVFFFFGNKNILYLVSFFQDSFLLILNYFLAIYCFRNTPRFIAFGKVLFFFFFLILGAVAFVYTIFLQDLITLPINLFSITIDHIILFMTYFLDLKLVLVTVSGIGLMMGVARYFPFKIYNRKLLKVATIAFSLLFLPTLLRPSLNPIVASILEQYLLSVRTNHKILSLEDHPVQDKEKTGEFRFLNKAFDTIPKLNLSYKRVIVLVMEGMTYNNFIGTSTSDKESFLNRYKNNIAVFNNYHTLNLDSYTSLLAMLNSIFIPYQAYVDDTEFSNVNNSNNLIRFFNSEGFGTLFLTSYGVQQERYTPDLKDWTQKTFMDSIYGNKNFVSVTSNKIEYGCEDLSVFGDMIKFLENNQKAFILQEMVYGHTVAWEQKTGIPPIDYYNNYFNKTVDELKKNNLLDSTLLLIVSDHGPRNKPYNIDNYHIPLLLYSNGMQEKTDSRFLSHVDFKDILLETISDYNYKPVENNIYTIGNSGEMNYGTIGSDGKYIFINNRMRTSESNTNIDGVLKFNKNFIDYRNYFDYLMTTKYADTISGSKPFFDNLKIFSFWQK